MANQMSLQDDNIFILQIRHEKGLNKKKWNKTNKKTKRKGMCCYSKQ